MAPAAQEPIWTLSWDGYCRDYGDIETRGAHAVKEMRVGIPAHASSASHLW